MLYTNNANRTTRTKVRELSIRMKSVKSHGRNLTTSWFRVSRFGPGDSWLWLWLYFKHPSYTLMIPNLGLFVSILITPITNTTI